MDKFAKIFDMPGDRQVLVTLRTDEEEIAIHQDTLVDGVYVRISLGFDSANAEKDAEHAFRRYNTDIAMKFFDGVMNILAG